LSKNYIKTCPRQDFILSPIFLYEARFFFCFRNYSFLAKVLRKIKCMVFVDIHHDRPDIERLAVQFTNRRKSFYLQRVSSFLHFQDGEIGIAAVNSYSAFPQKTSVCLAKMRSESSCNGVVNPDTSTRYLFTSRLRRCPQSTSPKGLIGREQHLFARMSAGCESETHAGIQNIHDVVQHIVAVLHLGIIARFVIFGRKARISTSLSVRSIPV